jgi:acyl-CoA synthetase (AMP-forming)/AMP-acid ligase II
MDAAESIIAALGRHARQSPDRIALRFLVSGDTSGPVREWTYRQLQSRVRATGRHLRHHYEPGTRVLLWYPPGADFAAGFLGCAYARLTAVPVHLPGSARTGGNASMLARIAASCDAQVILTTPAALRSASQPLELATEAAGPRWLATDTGSPRSLATLAADLDPPADDPDDIALLRYTPRPAGTPRLTRVTHADLTRTINGLLDEWHLDDRAQFVSWLPASLDLGLITGLLYPVLLGATATLLTQHAFAKRPLRWLEAISAYRGTVSAAPSAAYHLCTGTPARELDLSSWSVAAYSIDPDHHRTMSRFADSFAAAGFRRESLTACYGLTPAKLPFTVACRPRPPASWS